MYRGTLSSYWAQTSGFADGPPEHGKSRDDEHDQLRIDQVAHLGHGDNQEEAGDDPEDCESYHPGAREGRTGAHAVFDMGNAREDCVQHHVDALSALDCVDAVPYLVSC